MDDPARCFSHIPISWGRYDENRLWRLSVFAVFGVALVVAGLMFRGRKGKNEPRAWHDMNAIGRVRGLAVLESAMLFGILSTLLTWFVGRTGPCYSPPYSDIIVCPPGIHRGFPLAWVTDVDWPGHQPCLGLVCPTELKVDWFGLAIDLLFWTFLFALLLTLVIYRPKTSDSETFEVREPHA